MVVSRKLDEVDVRHSELLAGGYVTISHHDHLASAVRFCKRPVIQSVAKGGSPEPDTSIRNAGTIHILVAYGLHKSSPYGSSSFSADGGGGNAGRRIVLESRKEFISTWQNDG